MARCSRQLKPECSRVAATSRSGVEWLAAGALLRERASGVIKSREACVSEDRGICVKNTMHLEPIRHSTLAVLHTGHSLQLYYNLISEPCVTSARVELEGAGSVKSV